MLQKQPFGEPKILWGALRDDKDLSLDFNGLGFKVQGFRDSLTNPLFE